MSFLLSNYGGTRTTELNAFQNGNSSQSRNPSPANMNEGADVRSLDRAGLSEEALSAGQEFRSDAGQGLSNSLWNTFALSPEFKKTSVASSRPDLEESRPSRATDEDDIAPGATPFKSLEQTPLKKGMRGEQVARFKQYLNSFFKVDQNDVYDDATERAVKAYQEKRNLGKDGIVGNGTFGSIFSDLFWKDGTKADLGEKSLPKENLEVIVDLSEQRARVRDTQSGKILREYPISSGAPGFDTPAGNYQVTDKFTKPEWIPPNSDWARGSSRVPPGPDNPLGVAGLQLSNSDYLLHSVPTSKFGTLGNTPASHGCVRMYPHHVMQLHDTLSNGTSVRIVP
jgi:lipoprotein-anchoring transpeptidase ErfK/SrfK